MRTREDRIVPVNSDVPEESAATRQQRLDRNMSTSSQDHGDDPYTDESYTMSAHTRQVLKKYLSYEKIREAAIYFLDAANIKFSITFDDIMMMMTFFVLFADDIRIITAPKSVDLGFETMNSVCLFFFCFELILTTWAKTTITKWFPFPVTSGYAFSFFFWLDLIAIVSMFPDINWVARGMGISGIAESVDSTNSNFSKAGRVVRTVRLARLVRVYKITAERRRLKRLEEEQSELIRQGVMSAAEIERQKLLQKDRNSKVGAELSDTTTRRVIIIVLLMLCLVPVITYSEVNQFEEFSVHSLHKYNVMGDNNATATAVDTFIRKFHTVTGNRYIIRLDVQPFQPGHIINHPHLDNTLREIHIAKYKFVKEDGGTKYVTEGWFNKEPIAKEVALNGILLTLFVSFVMLAGTVVFTNDVQRLVLNPIERMMNMVEQVAKDPLQTLYFDHSEGSGEYETRLLESTIEKITGLLRVGFGEAGAGIISANLNFEDNSSVINPLIPGIRVYAIFGFCDIHHFEEVTEKLGKDVFTFVNTVAEIVHRSVHDWGGNSNKNLGNAFLVVWRIGDEATLADMLSAHAGRETTVGKKKKNQVIDLRRVPGVDVMADMALIGYLKIIAEINRADEVLAYRNEPRLTENGTHPFEVSMGFGLHAGWAIEGAVGSLQKVDATYLSPHVNMAARLETSSRQYGVPLLASENFFSLMSVDGQAKCRKLDVVTVKGSEVPIGIYTYDALEHQTFRKKHNRKGMTKAEQRALSLPIPKFCSPKDETSEVFEKDYDLVTLRKHVTESFSLNFRSGVDCYLQGDWSNARGFLEKANELMAEVPTMNGDGPSKTLLKYMEAHGWQAPPSWKGYRPLTSK